MDVLFKGEYITLQQLLKKVDVISSGGEIRAYLDNIQVFVNGELETRRGRKLYSGDEVQTQGMIYRLKD
jgi:ribosome-associated protein